MKTVRLVLFPEFQMLAYVLATETLRLANKCAATPVFSWRTMSATNLAVTASNGTSVEPDCRDWSTDDTLDLVLLCAGYDPLDHVTARVRAYLARLSAAGATLGGVDTGSVILAHLGYLDGHSAVLHYEAEASFRENWPDIAVSDQIYCLDGPRLTAAGGTATGDAMLAWVAQVASPALAAAASDGMAHGVIRKGDERQRLAGTKDAVLIAMKDWMSANLSDPLTIEQVCSAVGVSPKQLRRRCVSSFGVTPNGYYLGLRLENAFSLLKNTHLSITDISLATGFSSLSAFSRAFKRRFRLCPRLVRKSGRGL